MINSKKIEKLEIRSKKVNIITIYYFLGLDNFFLIMTKFVN